MSSTINIVTCGDICDLDKEYIRKVFIDSLISLDHDRDP